MSAELINLAAEQKSAEVTDWAARIGWAVGLLLFIAFVYWLMRQGWKWRGSLQSDLPELPQAPEAPETYGCGSAAGTTAPRPPVSGWTGSSPTASASAAGWS